MSRYRSGPVRLRPRATSRGRRGNGDRNSIPFRAAACPITHTAPSSLRRTHAPGSGARLASTPSRLAPPNRPRSRTFSPGLPPSAVAKSSSIVPSSGVMSVIDQMVIDTLGHEARPGVRSGVGGSSGSSQMLCGTCCMRRRHVPCDSTRSRASPTTSTRLPRNWDSSSWISGTPKRTTRPFSSESSKYPPCRSRGPTRPLVMTVCRWYLPYVKLHTSTGSGVPYTRSTRAESRLRPDGVRGGGAVRHLCREGNDEREDGRPLASSSADDGG